MTIPDASLHSGWYRGIALSKAYGRQEVDFDFKWRPNFFVQEKPRLGQFDVDGWLMGPAGRGPQVFSGVVVVIDARVAISQWIEVPSLYLLHGIARSFLLLAREVADRPLFSASNIEQESLIESEVRSPDATALWKAMLSRGARFIARIDRYVLDDVDVAYSIERRKACADRSL